MSKLSLLVKEPIVEDFLRIHFNSWEEMVQIKSGDFLGDMIMSLSMSDYKKPLPGNLIVQLPTHELFRHDRYPYQYMTKTRTLMIENVCLGLYKAMISQWVWSGMQRGMNRKAAINVFLSHYEAMAAPRKLHINYETIDKMIVRDAKRMAEVLREYNKRSRYQTFV